MNKLLIIFFITLFTTQLVAQSTRQTENFNQGWRFFKGDIPNGEGSGLNDNDWRLVELPHDWSIEGPFSNQWASGTGFLPAGIGWYRKTFDNLTTGTGKKVFIYFDGIYKNSETWLNGKLLGKRPNGYTPFQYDLTPYLRKGKNTLAVKVDHSQFADSRWYTGSGIYRNVYLITKSPVHISLWGTRFTTPSVTKESATANVTVSINNTLGNSATLLVESKLSREGKTISTTIKKITIPAGGNADVLLKHLVSKPALWSVDEPHLYTLTTTLKQNDKKTDEVMEKVGFRSFDFDAKTGFKLNGEQMKMKGVCIHHDAGALGAAVPKDVWRRRLMLLKEAGCNAIRMSHYPHQNYLYDLCDELGFLVQDEAFDEWEVGKNKWIEGWNAGKPGKDGYHQHFKDWAEIDLTDMILRNKNHPSIVMWSIGNEVDYPNDPYSHEVLNTGRNPQIYGRGYQPANPPASRLGEISRRLVAVAKKADSSRPITAALAGVVMSNMTSYPGNLDLVGYNYQEYRYADDHRDYPGRIMYGSENGKSIQAWEAVDTSKNIFAQFLWTGFDFMGEAGRWPLRSSGAGIMNLAGFPKNDFYIRQILWTSKPVLQLSVSKMTAEPGQRWRRISKLSWNWNKGDTLRVSAITNAEEVELFLNGRSIGRKLKTDTSALRFAWNLLYEEGELLLKSFSNGQETSRQSLFTTGEAKTMTASLDKMKLSAKAGEVAHIEIIVFDQKGHPVYEANNELTLTIAGPARLLGLESGDLASHEDYKLNRRKIYNGRLLAYVQAKDKKGQVTVTISSPGLETKMVEIAVVD